MKIILVILALSGFSICAQAGGESYFGKSQTSMGFGEGYSPLPGQSCQNGYTEQGGFCAPLSSVAACEQNGKSWSINGCVDPTMANQVQAGGAVDSQCREKTDTAVRICDDKNDSGIGMVQQMAQNLASTLGAQTASSLQAACSQMGKLSMAANAALTTFNTGCSREYLSCRSVCADELEAAKATAATNPGLLDIVRESSRKCNALQANLAAAANGIENMMATNANMQQCQSLTGNSIAEMCAKDPSLPVCGTQGPADCSDPNQAATNTVCICQRNPRDARCGLSGKMNTYNQASTGTGTDGGVDAGSFGSGNLGSADMTGDISFGKPGEAGQGSLAKGGAGGGKGGIGGSGGQNGGSNGPGGRGAGPNSNVLSGYYGGKPGTSGSVAGSANHGGYNAPAGAGGGRGNANVDLRQFMPGGKMDPQRGLAGVSGPDGITGPHTDIWKKVNKRYFAVTPSLLP